MHACSVEGCDRKYKAKGYCVRHYTQFIRHGHVLSRTRFDVNVYVDCGNYFEIILCGIHGEETGRALIDKDDIEIVRAIKWSIVNGYAGSASKNVYLHRLILGIADGDLETDHRRPGEENRLDCRKANLREATRGENSRNIGLTSRNTTGRKGVSKRSNGRWISRIRFENVEMHLGSFSDPDLAAAAYDEAAERLHGEFARTNARLES